MMVSPAPMPAAKYAMALGSVGMRSSLLESALLENAA